MRSCGLVLVSALLFFVLSNSTATAQATEEVVEESQKGALQDLSASAYLP
jgi:hypothetical protein